MQKPQTIDGKYTNYFQVGHNAKAVNSFEVRNSVGSATPPRLTVDQGLASYEFLRRWSRANQLGPTRSKSRDRTTPASLCPERSDQFQLTN
jgi:hypothetical protein